MKMDKQSGKQKVVKIKIKAWMDMKCPKRRQIKVLLITRTSRATSARTLMKKEAYHFHLRLSDSFRPSKLEEYRPVRIENARVVGAHGSETNVTTGEVTLCALKPSESSRSVQSTPHVLL